MKHIIYIIILLLYGQLYSQKDTSSIYKNLETRKFYSVGLSATTGSGEDMYSVNSKRISKNEYDKYHSTWSDMATCCPCILKTYDEFDKLLKEGVSCGDCNVGWFKTFNKNGNVNLLGFYKENSTNDWEDIYKRGYCNVPVGKWVYFNEDGDTLYSEIWDNGVFVKQVPEQNVAEIWKVEILYNGKEAKTVLIPISKINELTIVPKYKNSKTSDNLIIKFSFSAIGHKNYEMSFTMETFKNIDVESLLQEANIPNDKKISYMLSIYDGDRMVKTIDLKVEI